MTKTWTESDRVEMAQKTMTFCKDVLGLSVEESAWWLVTTGLSIAEELDADDITDRVDWPDGLLGPCAIESVARLAAARSTSRRSAAQGD